MSRRRRRGKLRTPMAADSKRGLCAVLIWVAAAVFAVVCAIIIGNVLGGAANAPQREKAELYAYEGKPADAANAVYFETNGHTEQSVTKAASALENGSQISFILRGAHGRAPNYRSEISLAVTGSAGGAFELSSLIGVLNEKGVRAIGCFYSVFSTVKGEARDALVDYEASLIAEAYEAGLREVLVLGLPTDRDGAAKASELFAKIREKAPDILLGSAVGRSAFASGDAAYVIDTYYKFSNFCTVDTSGAFAEGSSAAAFAKNYAYYFEKYPLRLLVEDRGEADRAATLAELSELGIKDVQSIPIASAG